MFNIKFILVEPGVPDNIGASARAIKTMGFTDMYLINPCDYKSGISKRLAHGASEILENAEVFTSLEAAITNMDMVIGTTTRKRISKSHYLDLYDLKNVLKRQYDSNSNIALVFGREESGLSNKELALCDITSSIQMVSKYPSLNLSQAVMLYAYALSPYSEKKATVEDIPASEDSLRNLKNKTEIMLSETKISGNAALKGKIMERLSLLDSKDIKLLHSVVNALLEKYEEDIK